jgi:hypothetical protein
LHSGFITFCRAVGLGLLPALFAAKDAEEAKIAIRKNRLTAVLRALIHLVPIGGAVALIALNCHQLFMGAYLNNISLLQFAAKLHELTMQASLAAIIFTYIRYELALGIGLPFGALFSGLQITQVSYLWSREFWGSISSTKIPIRRRLSLLVVILITTLLAAIVGPASAVAMIPRLENWPAGRTHIWLNASSEDIWPSFINASGIPASCSRVDSLALMNSCPSSRWRSLLDPSQSWQKLIWGQPGTNWGPDSLNLTILPNLLEIEMRNNNSYGTVDICGTFGPGTLCVNTMVTMQQASISDALVLIEQFWYDSVRDLIRDNGGRSVLHSIQSLQPFTHVLCLPDSAGVDDTTPIYFPNIFNPFNLPNLPQNVSFSGLTRSELANSVKNTSEITLVFVDLVGSEFPNATAGAIAIAPLGIVNPFDPKLVACYISSGWGISNMTGSGDTSLPSYVTRGSGFTTPPYEEQFGTDSQGNVTWSYLFPDFPLRHIRVTSEWATYLNPLITDLNTTLINILCGGSQGCEMELTLGLMMTNGLAQTGGSRGLGGNISWGAPNYYGVDGGKWLRGEDIFSVDSVESKDWVKLEVNSQVVGLAYATRGLPIKVAITILAIYIVVALVHFIYACVSGLSSTSWASISEVTALAINSPPTEDLQGTCAGIEDMGIFRIPVRILAAGGNAGVAETETPLQDVPRNEEHLELMFGDVEPARSGIVANKKYGTLKIGR